MIKRTTFILFTLFLFSFLFIHDYTLAQTKADAYNFKENELNNLGYQLIAKQKIDESIEIFKLNVEAYPDAFNTYDSLGEAYMINGDKELAIQNYNKSLELNPNNTNAVNMLERLEEK